MKTKKSKRLFSLVLCAMLICGFMSTNVSATGELYPSCEHHTHDENCGGLENACNDVCDTCVVSVQEMINALPNMQDINNANKEAVTKQLEDIHKVYILLSDAARNKIDFTKYSNAAFILATPQNYFGFAVVKTYSVPEGTSCPVPTFSFINEAGENEEFICNGISATSIEVAPNGTAQYIYLPEGTYTIKETVEGRWTASMTVNGVKDNDLTFSGNAGDGIMLVFTNIKEEPTAPEITGVVDNSTYYTTQYAEILDADHGLGFMIVENGNTPTFNVGTTDAVKVTLPGNTDTTYTIIALDKYDTPDSPEASATCTITMKSIASLSDPIKNLTEDNVGPDDTADIQAVIDAIKEVDTSTATDKEKEELENALKNAETLLDLSKKIGYKIIKGDKSTYIKGSNKDLTITADGPFNKFTDIKVDNKVIDNTNYTAVSGSTMVTLKASYLETLSIDDHSITFVYTDGEASGTFSVKNTQAADSSVKTGDNANFLLWSMLLLVCSACVVGVTVYTRRFRR